MTLAEFGASAAHAILGPDDPRRINDRLNKAVGDYQIGRNFTVVPVIYMWIDSKPK